MRTIFGKNPYLRGCIFAVVLLIVILWQSSCFASHVSDSPGGAYSWNGSSCASFLAGTAAQSSLFTSGSSTSQPANTPILCSIDPITVGDFVMTYRRNSDNAFFTWAVTVDQVDQQNENLALRFLALALLFGVGVIAGQQR